MRLPDLAGEEVHMVKMLVPVAKPGQVHLSARLQYRAGQVSWSSHKIWCDILFVVPSWENAKTDSLLWQGGGGGGRGVSTTPHLYQTKSFFGTHRF